MHAGLQWVYTGMSVSNGEFQLPLGHVGLRWVSAQACQSPIKHVEVSNGSLIRHAGVRWGMLVSDGSPMGHVGFRWVTN